MFVTDPAGEPLGGAASQRRLLALLAVLAVAGDAGLSRDKLVVLLWPDAEEERARHSLTQALYAARRALGADDLFVTAGDVRLNRERLSTDVQEIETALDGGELERAAQLYQGPFLDGFFLPGSTEFEQWSSAQRQRFEDRAVAALDRLARTAEDAGELREALDWRRRLAAIRPLDASVAVSLMHVLAQSGDRAGALQHARLHETLLRDQLGLDADPVVRALAARLREPVEWQAETATATLAPPAAEPPPVPVDTAAVDDPPDDVAPTRVARSAPPTRYVGGRTVTLGDATVRVVPPPGSAASARRWWTAALALVAAVASVALWPDRAPAPPRAPATPRLAQRVVVAPFRVSGASESLAYLRDGLVELLSARLADDSAARSVDAGAVLAAWRASTVGRAADVPRDSVVALAARLGAERVVLGSVVGTPSRLVVSASVVAVPAGAPVGEATVEGPADSLSVLIDRLAARLLVAGAGEEPSLAAHSATSLRALRAYLDGQAAFRRGSLAFAQRRYEEALQLDSTFAPAALQLARTADRLFIPWTRARALALAWRRRDALDERARAQLVAMIGPRYPEPSAVDEQLAAWDRLVDLTPDRAEPWYELAVHLVREGALADAGGAARARSALRRALVLQPEYAPARELLAQLDATAPEDDRLSLAPFLRWRAAVARGDSAAVRAARASMADAGPTNLRAIAAAAQLDAVAVADARRAVRLLVARAARPPERLDAALAEHALASNEGRVGDAQAATERLAELRPGARVHLRLRVLDALYGDGRPEPAADAAARLARAVDGAPAPDPAARAVQLADACVLAQWRLARGDTAGVERAREALAAEPLRMQAAGVPAATLGPACARLLDAAAAVERRAPDAAARVAALDSLMLVPGVAGDAVTYAPILAARLHARLGDPARALAAVRRRTAWTAWPRYEAAALRDEARYATLAGDAAGARRAHERFLALRPAPDPALRAQVAAVRAALAALTPR